MADCDAAREAKELCEERAVIFFRSRRILALLGPARARRYNAGPLFAALPVH